MTAEDSVTSDAPAPLVPYGLAALLGAASVMTVPLVTALADLVLGPDAGLVGDGTSGRLETWLLALVVFLVVQALMFRAAAGTFRPRVVYFPALAFQCCLALAYPYDWSGLAAPVGPFMWAVVTGAGAGVLTEAVLVPELEKKMLPVLLVVSLAAAMALVAPALLGGRA